MMTFRVIFLVAAVVASHSASGFTLSNTLGDDMVLQRHPKAAVVWGFGDAGVTVTTTFLGQALPPATVGADGVWRQVLPAQPATTTPTTISFSGTDGGRAELKDVLFGDVFLCSGQSNMQYTPNSMKGMNNKTAEMQAVNAYGSTVRLFTVGMQTKCAETDTDCSKPFRQLNTSFFNSTCVGDVTDGSCRHLWAPASYDLLNDGGKSWDTFSAVCWLMGRDIHDGLGGKVPVGK